MQNSRNAVIFGAFAVTLATAGCQQSGVPAPAPTATVSAEAAPASEEKPALTVSDARLVLPAVRGRPGAVYFTLANTRGRGETLVGAAVRGAREAQMHETSGGSMTSLKSVPVAAHGTLAFAPGARHIMVFGVPSDLRAGSTSELTLSFAGGERVSAPLKVLAAGTGGHDDMAGMHMDH